MDALGERLALPPLGLLVPLVASVQDDVPGSHVGQKRVEHAIDRCAVREGKDDDPWAVGLGVETRHQVSVRVGDEQVDFGLFGVLEDLVHGWLGGIVLRDS